MNTVNLNLARKWRSKNFDQIVGQDLSVRMLKNSLYLNQFFPVYLFAGQRGCGKTSTARIFAMAINCAQLSDFQKNPKATLMPCGVCASCTAMLNGNHPDFFEIDAASHTGVDTIRQIIDASLLLPIMGSKKIYLIDEAHMLSKASFNALLKILEEPPTSVIFMLATTDTQKIIETVRSRCFQLLFKPIDTSLLVNHLATICTSENIGFDQDALELIVQESEGSARDALNILEQVRFSSGMVDKASVRSIFGHVSEEQLMAIFESVIKQSPAQLLAKMQEIGLQEASAEYVWYKLAEFARMCIWLKHGVPLNQSLENTNRLKKLAQETSWLTFHTLLDQLYTQEPLLLKTSNKYAVLEMILLQLSHKNKKKDENSNGAASLPQTALEAADEIIHESDESDEEVDEEEEDEDENIDDDYAQSWQPFLNAIASLNDQLLLSIFKQAQFIRYDRSSHQVIVEFSREFGFFKDWIQDTEPRWIPLLKQHFGNEAHLVPQFSLVAQPAQVPIVAPEVRQQKEVEPVLVKEPVQQKTFYKSTFKKQSTPVKTPKFDVADAAQWPFAHALLRHFPGTIYEVKGQ